MLTLAGPPQLTLPQGNLVGRGRRREVLEYLRSAAPDGVVSWGLRHTAEMKPFRCLLHLHVWHTYHNDEGQRYQLCTRCGAYREKYTLTNYGAGPGSY